MNKLIRIHEEDLPIYEFSIIENLENLDEEEELNTEVLAKDQAYEWGKSVGATVSKVLFDKEEDMEDGSIKVYYKVYGNFLN